MVTGEGRRSGRKGREDGEIRGIPCVFWRGARKGWVVMMVMYGVWLLVVSRSEGWRREVIELGEP